jgi:anti-anti-sigma factor
VIVSSAQVRPGLAVLTVRGEVDMSTADRLRTEIEDALDRWHPKELHVDLAAVPFMDSLGISALVAGYQAAHRADAVFRLVAASPGLVSVLHLSGLLDIFGYEPPSSSIAR